MWTEVGSCCDSAFDCVITLLQHVLVFKTPLYEVRKKTPVFEVNIADKEKDKPAGDFGSKRRCSHCAGQISRICIKVSPSPPLFFCVQDWWIQTGSASAPPHTPYAGCRVLSPCSVRGWHWAEASQYILSPHTVSLTHRLHVQIIPGECVICYSLKESLYAAALHTLKWMWPFHSPPSSWNVNPRRRISVWTLA